MAKEPPEQPEDQHEEPPDQPRRGPLTEAQRRRLQKCFEHASKQMAQENYDYATDLLTQCVLGDPGNLGYVQNYMGNLQKKYKNNKKGSSWAMVTGRSARSAVKKATAQSDWGEVIKHGLAALALNPWDVPTLRAMASASAALLAEGEAASYGECELFYLKCAVEVAPKDPDLCRQLAATLGKRQRFDEAIAFWHRVEQAKPGDEEAQRAIASLAVEKTIVKGGYGTEESSSGKGKPQAPKAGGPAQPAPEEISPEELLKRKIARDPNDRVACHELVELYLGADRYKEAEELLQRLYKLSNNDPEVWEKLEDVRLRRLRQRMVAAEKRYKETRSEEAKTEFKKVRRAIIEKELGVWKSRCDRYPNNLNFKYELGCRHKLLGDYSEAIKIFQVAKNDPRRKGVCMLMLGECFERIKQYPLAIRHYELAIEEIPDREADNKKSALYQAGRLAFQLDDLEKAEKHLSGLAALDFAYKDVAELLEKIAKRRENK